MRLALASEGASKKSWRTPTVASVPWSPPKGVQHLQPDDNRSMATAAEIDDEYHNGAGSSTDKPKQVDQPPTNRAERPRLILGTLCSLKARKLLKRWVTQSLTGHPESLRKDF